MRDAASTTLAATAAATERRTDAAAELPQRVAAECIGTLLLVAVVIGSGIMGERLAGGNAAIALLGNTLATAAALVVLITWLGPVSGAHFNPVVSLVMLARRELAPRAALAYLTAQVAGACAGALLAHAMFELPLLQASSNARAGGAQWLAEAVATFGLLATILGCRDHRWLPALVAAWITAGYWFTASTSFANPAVTVARALTDTFAGIRAIDVPGFVLAQVVGATAAALLLPWLHGRRPRDRAGC